MTFLHKWACFLYTTVFSHKHLNKFRKHVIFSWGHCFGDIINKQQKNERGLWSPKNVKKSRTIFCKNSIDYNHMIKIFKLYFTCSLQHSIHFLGAGVCIIFGIQ